MFIPSAFDIISRMSNEKTAIRAALYVRKNALSTRLPSRLIASAADFLDFVQTTYEVCRECLELTTTDQEDPTIHDECLKVLREDDAYWKNFEKEMEQERKDQEALERQQKADEDAWSIFESDQAALERHEQEALDAEEEEEEQEELDSSTYDEENFFPAETDDITVAPAKKEN